MHIFTRAHTDVIDSIKIVDVMYLVATEVDLQYYYHHQYILDAFYRSILTTKTFSGKCHKELLMFATLHNISLNTHKDRFILHLLF